MSETRRYRIRGLDCAEEVAALRKTVGTLPGTSQLDFDILSAKMTVTVEPGAVEEEDVLAAVREAGLEALPWSEARQEGEAAGHQGFWERRGRLTMCIASGVLLVVGFVAHAVLHGGIVDAFVAGEGIGQHYFPLLSILLYIGSMIAGGLHVLPKAWASVRTLRLDMNFLMVTAMCGAAIIGQWFEASTVAFLFSVALLLESWTVERARRAIGALMDLAPKMARCICPCHGDIEERPIADVPVGTTVLVRPGEKIPLDGVVIEGRTSVNQAPITGESAPVVKETDSPIFAGSINNEGAFKLKTTKVAEDTTLARIIRMVEESRSRRAPYEQWVEKFARYYTPAMMAAAVVVAVIPPLLGGAWSAWAYRALVLLVIACPCALVISTPVTIVAGLTAAAHAGVLIKGGAYLEAPAHLEVVAFDKTGTITRGHPVVQEVCPLNGHTPQELLARAAALEASSEHPLARAIRDKAQSERVVFATAQDFLAIKGKGAEGTIDGRRFWIGSHRLVAEKGMDAAEVHAWAEQLEDAGHSVVAIGNDQHVCGLISIADEVKPGADAVIRELRTAGIKRVVMLTGDNEGTARAVAQATGVSEFKAELLPEDKVRAVKALAGESDHVMMVGDGVNDAPAMSAATLGVAMGAAGTDAAIETADIALMSDDLARLPWLIRHSRRTLAVIRQNIWFALGLKAIFMVLAVAGVATLWMAIAADTGASLLVIFNGLRLLK